MLLRSRITLIVAVGFVLMAASLTVAGWLRDRITQQRTDEIAIEGQFDLWREIVAVRTTGLASIAEIFARAPGLKEAIYRRDRFAVARIATEVGRGLEDGPDAQMVEILSPEGELLYVANRSSPRLILDAGTLDRAFADEEIRGLRQADPGQLLLVEAQVVELDGGGRGLVVVARNAARALERFASRIEGAATLVTLRGRVAATTDAALWQATGLAPSPRRPAVETVEVGERTYGVVSIPVRDVNGGAVGAVVSLQDITRSQTIARLLRNGTMAGAALLTLIGILTLNYYLWRSFRPLESALDVLEHLSLGSAPRPGLPNRRDEIGRVTDAVAALRASQQQLAETRRQRLRVRLRQEGVIRHELSRLADQIDPSDRNEVLALLGPAGEVRHEAADDELRRLARVMRDLSRRIADQHGRLTGMVAELREALVTKTKLIGIQQELEIARRVQSAILPKTLIPDGRLAVEGRMTPAQEVGGDFYDYFMIDDDTLGFVIADVSGKGVPAALFMAITRTLVKTTALFERSPSGCVRRVNELLAAQNDQMLFVTLVYGTLDLASGRVTYVNAGHNPPYRIGAGGDVSTLGATGGMAVAVVEGFPYVEHTLDLAPGETLFLFTDGVTEAFDVDGEAYGDARIAALLATGADRWSIAELSERVLASVHAFERGADQADDITLLTLRYHGPDGKADAAPVPQGTREAMNRLELDIPNRIEDVGAALAAVEAFCETHDMPARAVHHVTLALDELITNVVSYAWPAGGEHHARLTLDVADGSLIAELVDDGVAFNPLEVDAPDLDAPLDERRVGGLGVHFVLTFMDDIRYERIGGRNHLTLRKHLNGNPPQ
ncbi:ATP-binding SpoIIE family protein phosphatase [Ancylobacter terrae]|uniref:ATP-binding SpoIIE family protein phosphatase n=1 Tax=Ancylobacter sp. sgz301288 TaxID=3342077 RepID=UPI003858DC6F